MEGWSDCLRLELKPFGIDVIIIEPGVIATDFGEVMVGPLLERSGDTAYGKLAHRVARATRRNYGAGRGSPPSLIAGVVAEAIATRRPKTRYAVGKYARPLILARTVLGDRLFDRLILLAT